jgi:hypothetical protein
MVCTFFAQHAKEKKNVHTDVIMFVRLNVGTGKPLDGFDGFLILTLWYWWPSDICWPNFELRKVGNRLLATA